MPSPIEPLDLEALRVLKQATTIDSQGIEPMVDAAYVLRALEAMTAKLNQVIDRANKGNYNEKIQVVASKLNQVVAVMNANTSRLANDLSAELKELERDLPKD